MKPESPHADFCAELTRDLQDDPELRRDVSRELEAHLDDAVALARSRGLDETAAEAEAMEHFGPASGLPQMLIEGNLLRMKSRARAKILIEWVLIPLCLIAALFIGWRESRALNGEPLTLPAAIAAAKPQTPEEERAMALRELTSCDDQNRAERFARARQLDPDNGWIDWMELAPRIKDNAETQADFPEIVRALEKAYAKSRWDDGVEVDVKRQFRSLDAAEQAIYQLRICKIGLQTGATVQGGSQLGTLKLTRGLARRGLQESAAGNTQEATRYFQVMDCFMLKLAQGRNFIDSLVLVNASRNVLNEPGLRQCLANATEWQIYLHRLEAFEPIVAAQRKIQLDTTSREAIEKHGSALHMMAYSAIPGMSSLDAELLNPGRRTEYAYGCRMLAMMSMTTMFAAFIFGLAALLALRVQFRTQGAFLPLPRLVELMRHLVLTCLLPMTIYEIYKLQEFSSHAWSIKYSIHFIQVEQFLLLIFLPLLSCWLWRRRVTMRLRALGLEGNTTTGLAKRWALRLLHIATLLIILKTGSHLLADQYSMVP